MDLFRFVTSDPLSIMVTLNPAFCSTKAAKKPAGPLPTTTICSFLFLYGISKTSFFVSSQNFLKDHDVKSWMGEDELKALNDHSDYNKIEHILNSLREDILSIAGDVQDVETGVIFEDFSLNQICVNRGGFFFNGLRGLSKGHVFSDVANLVITFSINSVREREIVSETCAKFGVDNDWNLYQKFYKLELRKKCLSYIVRYLKEIYLFESSRPYEIIRVIDEFSQAYERMYKIPVFKEYREFIRKNVTEPILEDSLVE